MQTLSDRRLLTVRETADRLAVSEDTVRRLIARGELPAIQLGGRGSSVRIDETELEGWLYGPSEVVRAHLHHLQLSRSGSRGARDDSAAATVAESSVPESES